MTNAPHSNSCARRVARGAKTTGSSDYEAALEVHQHCGVSLLRAHRIARGYTLMEAVESLKEVLAARGTPSEGLGHQRLSQWEHGPDTPSPHYLDALCSLYHTRPDRLGFGHDYSDPEPVSQKAIQDAMDRRNFVGLASAGALLMTAPLGLYGENCDPPGGPRANASYVNLLEALTEDNGYQLYAPPTEFITARMVDLARIQACLLTTTAEDLRRRLHRVYAKNAGFIAMRLTDIADASSGFEWFRAARRAAHLAEDTTVQAWVAGWTCDACAGHGQYPSGLAAAHAAQSAGARRPNSSAVLGYLTEAAVQARLGRRRETFDAIRNSDRMFAQLPDTETVADGFHVGEYLLRWHQANALALVGAHAQASQLRRRVLELPLADLDHVGMALLRLDEAAAQVEAGELEFGCHTITVTWQQFPDRVAGGLVPQRVAEILRTLEARPHAIRHARDVRELLEASPAGREALM